MSAETLQSEAESAPIDAEVSQADPIQESDLAPAAEETASESATNQTDVNQESINKVINKKHFEKMEAERRADAAEAKVRDFEEKALAVEQTQVNNIPEMPEDTFDKDYDRDMSEWKAAVQNKAVFDANQTILAQNQQAEQMQAQQKAQQQETERSVKFLDNAKSSGISNDEISGLLQTIGSYGGIGSENAAFVMSDINGGLIVKYLAANPQEIMAMQQMNGYTLANHINLNIRAKALALKPKQSKATPPATNISGGGADQAQGKHSLIKGYSLE